MRQILSVGGALIGQHDLHRPDVQLTDDVLTLRQCIAQTQLRLMSHFNQLLKRSSLNPIHTLQLAQSSSALAAAATLKTFIHQKSIR